MINVKLTAPVFKKSEFGRFDRTANIEIAGDFDTFSQGYTFLRTQIDELLQQQGAQNTMLLNLDDLNQEIANKERTLQLLKKETETAKNQLQRLQNFLERLGIDPSSYSLLIANGPLGLSSTLKTAAEVVDPIPFDCLDDNDNPHEF